MQVFLKNGFLASPPNSVKNPEDRRTLERCNKAPCWKVERDFRLLFPNPEDCAILSSRRIRTVYDGLIFLI